MKPRPLITDVAGSGDPLVLVPGGLTGWLSWIPHQELLASHHQVIRLQPIHNELGSAGCVGHLDYSLQIETESLRLTFDELGIDKADVAGWSRGAWAAMSFAAAHPQRVRTLTLVEPPAAWVLGDIGWDPLALHAGLSGREVSEDDLAGFLARAGLVDRPEDARTHPLWDHWVPHRMALSWPLRPGPNGESLDALRAIRCPVLLVKGRSTARWQGEVVDVLSTVFPSATLVDLDGGHACHIESIDAFMQAMDDHLGRAGAGP